MRYSVRPAEVLDVDNGLLETLGNLQETGLHPLDAKQVLEDMILSPVYRMYVAVSGKTVIGVATLLIEQKLIHNGGKVGRIEDVATKPGCERLGIGFNLVGQLVVEAQVAGCYKVILECNENNVPFYSKIGFHRHEVGMRMDL